MLDYRALPKQGAVIGEDLGRGAGWSYDTCVASHEDMFAAIGVMLTPNGNDVQSAKREWISFDTPNVGATKARYIRDQGLGGAMFWELDAVRPTDDPPACVTPSDQRFRLSGRPPGPPA